MKPKTGVASAGALTRSLGALQSRTFDIVVVGGGVTGAAIARLAAKAGLSVALLDEADFASGASGKFTSAIPTTLRGLAIRDVNAQRQAATERVTLHRMAPHLVEPVTVFVPLRTRVQSIKFSLQFLIWKSLRLFGVREQRVLWKSSESFATKAGLQLHEYPFVRSFQEYLTDNPRLTIAALRDASLNGAECANYLRIESVEKKHELHFLSARDLLSDKELSIRSRCVVNATGPWIEQLKVNHESRRFETAIPLLSRVFHIGVPQHRLRIDSFVLLEVETQQTVFAFSRGQVTYIGSTDTVSDVSLARWPSITIGDIEYLLAATSKYFGDSELQPTDVISSWAGVCPSISRSGGATQKTSANGELSMDTTGVISVSCGKLNDFSLVAKNVMTFVGRTLGRDLDLQGQADVLPGGYVASNEEMSDSVANLFVLESEVARIRELIGLGEDVALRLVRLYGAEVDKVLGYSPRLLSASVFAEEVDWAVRIEGAVSLEDVLYRRLRCVLFEPQELAVLAPAVAEHMANILRWDSSEQRRQRIAFEERIAFDLAAVPLAG